MDRPTLWALAVLVGGLGGIALLYLLAFALCRAAASGDRMNAQAHAERQANRVSTP